ncbi:MAG: PAS domain S-box protein [Ignavibacteriales bacterium]|nr:PAS domain S-box protein [Ignavibacteriales bacterium]
MKKGSEPLIRKWQVLSLIGVISVLLISGAYFYLSFESKSIRTSKHLEIQAIAEMKIQQLVHWRKDKTSDVTVISQSPFFQNKIIEWVSNRTNLLLKKELIERLSLTQQNYRYENIFISSPNGKLLLTLDNKLSNIDSITSLKIMEASKNKELTFTDLYKDAIHNRIHYDIIAPIINNQKITVAVLVFRIDPNEYLYPLIKSRLSFSATSEAFIFRRDGDSILFLSELNHLKNADLNYRIPLSKRDDPAVQAVLRNNRIYEGKDYNGNDEILSYIAPVPGTNWYITAQISQSEVYKELYLRALAIIIFTVGLILLVSGGLILIYRTRQRNIYIDLFTKEKELRETHEEFKTILYSIGDGVITTDIGGRIKQMNHTAEELTGWNENDAKGKLFDEVFSIIDDVTRNKVENPITKVLNQKVTFGLTNHTILISRNGKEIPITESSAPVRDQLGKIEGSVLIFRNKSDEQNSEKIVRKSEARLRRAEFVTKAGHWEYHLASGDMLVSEGASKIYGLKGTQWKVSTIQKMALHEYRSKLDDALSKLIKHGDPLDIEFKIRKADTGEVIDIHAIAEYDNEKKIAFGIVQDITKTKQFEIALKDSEYKFRMLVENIKIGIYYSDFAGTFLYGNREAEKIVGYNRNELIGKNFIELKILDQKQKIKAALLLGKNLIGKATGPDEFIINRKDGTKRIVEISTNVINTGDQRIVCGAVLDITERKQVEEALITSENKYRHLFENNPQPMWIYDLENLSFLEVNGAAILHYWYSRNEFLNMTIKDIHPEEDIKALLENIANTYKEINRAGIWRHKKKNGEIIFAEIISHLIKYEGRAARLVMAQDVTERKLAEEALKESYEFNKSLLKTIPFGMNIVDETGTIIFMSDSFKKLFDEEAIGKKCWAIYRDDKTQCSGCPLKKNIVIGETLELESENILSKKTFQISHTGMVFQGKKAVLEIFQDITERKKVEETLRESEERFKQIVECSGVWIWEVDTEGLYTYVSPMVENILGYKPEEVIGQKHFYDFFAPEAKAEMTVAAFGIFSRKETIANFENPNVHKNGSIVILETSGLPLLDGNGNFLGYRGADKNITERKNAEQTIDLLAQAVRSTSDCISLTDINNNILFVNESFIKTYGYETKELIGKNIELVRASTNPDPSIEMIKNATLQNGWFGELLNRKKDGTVFPISLSTSSVLNENGEPYALIGITRDITEYKKADIELQEHRNHLEDLVESRTKELDRINKKLQVEIEKEKEIEMMLQYSLEKEKELNELKTRFISIASHEFRTPLTSILSSAELIKRYGKKWSEEKFNEHADKIMSSIEYLTDLLDDVLTISRSESGKIIFNPLKIDLHLFCWDIIEELKFNEDKNHKLIFKYTADREIYELDPKLIRFIITNLLSNAFKYSPKGSTVELLVFSTYDSVVINVKDEGIGIPEEDKTHLFEPFYRTKNVGEIEGTGLGLSIVKRAVDLHDGVIKYFSELGKGTTFNIKLPRKKDE